MARKPAARSAAKQPPFPDNIKDSAQQIWLAGLGAFNKAQEEGSKVFDALVQEGLVLQRKTQTAAEAKLSEASNKVNAMASDLGNRATGQWGKLESIFEDRVAKALHQLGVPVASELQALAAQVEKLGKAVEKLSAKPAAKSTPRKAASPRATIARSAAKKSTRKPAPKTPSSSGKGRV